MWEVDVLKKKSIKFITFIFIFIFISQIILNYHFVSDIKNNIAQANSETNFWYPLYDQDFNDEITGQPPYGWDIEGDVRVAAGSYTPFPDKFMRMGLNARAKKIFPVPLGNNKFEFQFYYDQTYFELELRDKNDEILYKLIFHTDGSDGSLVVDQGFTGYYKDTHIQRYTIVTVRLIHENEKVELYLNHVKYYPLDKTNPITGIRFICRSNQVHFDNFKMLEPVPHYTGQVYQSIHYQDFNEQKEGEIPNGWFLDGDLVIFNSTNSPFSTNCLGLNNLYGTKGSFFFPESLTNGKLMFEFREGNSHFVFNFIDVNGGLVFSLEIYGTTYWGWHIIISYPNNWFWTDPSIGCNVSVILSHNLINVQANDELIIEDVPYSGNPINEVILMADSRYTNDMDYTYFDNFHVLKEVDENNVPEVSHPPDMCYLTTNELEHVIRWEIIDENVQNGLYSIYKDNIPIIKDQPWNSPLEVVEINIGDLQPGNYVYEIYILDGYGYYCKDSVSVRVINPPSHLRRWYQYNFDDIEHGNEPGGGWTVDEDFMGNLRVYDPTTPFDTKYFHFYMYNPWDVPWQPHREALARRYFQNDLTNGIFTFDFSFRAFHDDIFEDLPTSYVDLFLTTFNDYPSIHCQFTIDQYKQNPENPDEWLGTNGQLTVQGIDCGYYDIDTLHHARIEFLKDKIEVFIDGIKMNSQEIPYQGFGINNIKIKSICGVMDFDNFKLFEYDPPIVVEGREDFVMQQGDTSQLLMWTISGLFTGDPLNHYWLYHNDKLIEHQKWDSSAWVFGEIDPNIEIGMHSYLLVVEDYHGNLAVDEVLIEVTDYELPEVTPAPDVTFYKGMTGYKISWIITGSILGIPTYTVRVNNSIISEGVWYSGQEIVINLDDLNPGFYIYRIDVDDGQGGTTFEEVDVTVYQSIFPDIELLLTGYSDWDNPTFYEDGNLIGLFGIKDDKTRNANKIKMKLKINNTREYPIRFSYTDPPNIQPAFLTGFKEQRYMYFEDKTPTNNIELQPGESIILELGVFEISSTKWIDSAGMLIDILYFALDLGLALFKVDSGWGVYTLINDLYNMYTQTRSILINIPLVFKYNLQFTNYEYFEDGYWRPVPINIQNKNFEIQLIPTERQFQHAKKSVECAEESVQYTIMSLIFGVIFPVSIYFTIMSAIKTYEEYQYLFKANYKDPLDPSWQEIYEPIYKSLSFEIDEADNISQLLSDLINASLVLIGDLEAVDITYDRLNTALYNEDYEKSLLHAEALADYEMKVKNDLVLVNKYETLLFNELDNFYIQNDITPQDVIDKQNEIKTNGFSQNHTQIMEELGLNETQIEQAFNNTIELNLSQGINFEDHLLKSDKTTDDLIELYYETALESQQRVIDIEVEYLGGNIIPALPEDIALLEEYKIFILIAETNENYQEEINLCNQLIDLTTNVIEYTLNTSYSFYHEFAFEHKAFAEQQINFEVFLFDESFQIIQGEQIQISLYIINEKNESDTFEIILLGLDDTWQINGLAPIELAGETTEYISLTLIPQMSNIGIYTFDFLVRSTLTNKIRIVSFEIEILDDDVLAPTIISVDYNEIIFDSDDNIVFNISAFDDSGIESVVLIYEGNIYDAILVDGYYYVVLPNPRVLGLHQVTINVTDADNDFIGDQLFTILELNLTIIDDDTVYPTLNIIIGDYDLTNQGILVPIIINATDNSGIGNIYVEINNQTFSDLDKINIILPLGFYKLSVWITDNDTDRIGDTLTSYQEIIIEINITHLDCLIRAKTNELKDSLKLTNISDWLGSCLGQFIRKNLSIKIVDIMDWFYEENHSIIALSILNYLVIPILNGSIIEFQLNCTYETPCGYQNWSIYIQIVIEPWIQNHEVRMDIVTLCSELYWGYKAYAIEMYKDSDCQIIQWLLQNAF